jgi:hypothetical protein
MVLSISILKMKKIKKLLPKSCKQGKSLVAGIGWKW